MNLPANDIFPIARVQIPKETVRATKDSRPSISPEAPELGPLSLVGLPKIRLRPLNWTWPSLFSNCTLSPSWPCDDLLSNYKCEDSPQLCWRSQCDQRLDPHVEMVAATIGLVCCIRLAPCNGGHRQRHGCRTGPCAPQANRSIHTIHTSEVLRNPKTRIGF